MAVVPDASPLIVLSKIGRAELLSKLYGEVLLTPWVWEEAVAVGKTIGARDAASLEKAAQAFGFVRIRLKTVEKELAQELKNSGTGTGEAEVLAVARSRKALAILDDKDARATALGMGVDHIGTAGVLYEAFVNKLVTYEEFLDLLEKLGRVAWISPELLAGIIRKAGEVKQR